jgi:hypothetical protein
MARRPARAASSAASLIRLARSAPEKPGVPRASHGVELVEKDDACRVLPRFLEEATDTRGPDAGKHLDEVRAAGKEERHPGFARNRPRQQRLAGSRGADQEHALGNPPADQPIAGRLAQKLDDLLDLFLRLVDTGDIGERHLGVLGHRAARVLLDRRQPTRVHPVEHEGEQAEKGEGDDQRAGAEHHPAGRRPDVDANAAPDEVRHKRRLCRGKAHRGDGLDTPSVLAGADITVGFKLDRRERPVAGQGEELREGHFGDGRRRPADRGVGPEREDEQSACHKQDGATMTKSETHEM